MVDLANYLYRAFYLLGLAIAPRVLSPDPATPRSLAVALLVPLCALGGVLAGAYLLKKRLDSREARIAAALMWVSVAAALGAAIFFSGPRAPLARGAAPLALVVWPTLAAVAAALAGSYLGSNWKHKRSAAAALVIAGGLFVHADGAKNMGDATHQWKTALAREPDNEAAFENVTRAWLAQGKLDEVVKQANACLKVAPGACTCLVTKATALQRKREADRGSADKALQAAADAAKACPMVTAARAAHAEALASVGRLDEAYAEADEALALPDDPARAHTAKASVLMAAGKVQEAEAEAQKAVEVGGGRDAKLFIASLAITAGNLDAAEAALRPLLAERPQDADVQYNLALIADKRDKYNDARNGYLAALKIDPKYKAARYNLALLTFRRGVTEEAKNHAKKYAEIAPNDPSAAQLLSTVFGSSQPAP